uniref:Pentatricopeptide repeat-containing protein n=1 Tax=Kalanchoe fedtschenkoi TaxID=63787 RepID=A0A7N0VEQ7_KALFE
MNRSRSILSSLGRAKSLIPTRHSQSHSLFNQVNHHQLSSVSSISSVGLNRGSNTHFVSHQKKALFSTGPKSLLSLIAENEWCDGLETELENYMPQLCHETVVYVLRKLDKDPQKAHDFFNWVFEKKGFKPSSSVGSLMLRILVLKDMKNFWVTLRKLKERGFYLDGETYVTLLGIFKKEKMLSDATALMHFYGRMKDENVVDGVVRELVKVVLDSEWSEVVERELGGLVDDKLSDNFVLRALRELRNWPMKALSFFRWVNGVSGYGHSTVTYNALLRVLGRSESINEFWSALEEMKNAGHEIDIDTYIKLSRLFQKYVMFEDAVRLYEVMMDGPYSPSSQECNMLLRSVATSTEPNMNLMWRVVKKYDASGHGRSKAVYDGLHRALTSLGKFDEAKKVVDTMKNAGYEPDNITYSQVVFGLCKFRRFEEACKVLDEMDVEGCVPDIKTWTILIQGHFRGGEVDRALECFSKMIAKGIDPDADVLDVLVKGFLDHNEVERANQFIKETVGTLRLRPWQATYKHLIEVLLQGRKFEEALDLLVSMKNQNYPPCPEPFVEYISKHGTVADAVEFLSALSSKAFPSISAYVNVFKSFINEGRHADATDLLYKCPHHVRSHQEIFKLFGSQSNVKSPAAEGQTSLPLNANINATWVEASDKSMAMQ